MEKIRYPWDWRVLLLGAGGLAAMFIIAIVSNPSYPQHREFFTVFGTIFLFIVLNFTLGTYGLLEKRNGVLSRTDYAFYTKRLNVRDIKTIQYQPTWIIGGIARSLYIVDNHGNVIEFPNVGWYEPVLAKIANDLRQLNPTIELDEDAEALVEKYRAL